jgi:hypothetical protein
MSHMRTLKPCWQLGTQWQVTQLLCIHCAQVNIFPEPVCLGWGHAVRWNPPPPPTHIFPAHSVLHGVCLPVATYLVSVGGGGRRGRRAAQPPVQLIRKHSRTSSYSLALLFPNFFAFAAPSNGSEKSSRNFISKVINLFWFPFPSPYLIRNRTKSLRFRTREAGLKHFLV